MDLSMRIAEMSTQMSANKVESEVGTAMLSKSLDLQKEMGDGLTKMMERSVAPHLGGNFDMSV